MPSHHYRPAGKNSGSEFTSSPLTARQAVVLKTIQKFISDWGYPPTRVELADLLGFASANAAHSHMKALERKGYIAMHSGVARGVVVLADEAALS